MTQIPLVLLNGIWIAKKAIETHLLAQDGVSLFPIGQVAS